MKTSFLLRICALVSLNCANKKNSTSKSEDKPKAELSLAPGHIHADLKITFIKDEEKRKVITAEVLEVLKYGSSTEPVPANSSIKFYVTNDALGTTKDYLILNNKINAVLSKSEGPMMMGDQKSEDLWKLITINN